MLQIQLDSVESLLCRSVKSPEVIAYFGTLIDRIERDEFYGTIDLKNEGIEVVFIEIRMLRKSPETSESNELYLDALHFHRQGHENSIGFDGPFPQDLKFSDHRTEIVKKLGDPIDSGGGNYIRLLNRTAPNWVKYDFKRARLHLQLDADDRLEMVTLQGNCRERFSNL